MAASAIHNGTSLAKKTVVVLGGSYGGYKAAHVLGQGLPQGWRVVLIDRNSHANHVYTLPRYSVLPGHEYKAFIPYTKVFAGSPAPNTHEFIHGNVSKLTPSSVTVTRAATGTTEDIPFNYAVYALGAHLPAPIDLWGTATAAHASLNSGVPTYSGAKAEGVVWLKRHQTAVEKADSVLVVGGGALGIQYAADIAEVHPSKKVTLLHSRKQLLPRFDESMHSEIIKALQALKVSVILGERLSLDSVYEDPPHRNALGERVVKTLAGRGIAADLIMLCTGQRPNTELLKSMDPRVIVPETSQARVLRTLQLALVPAAARIAAEQAHPQPDSTADASATSGLSPSIEVETPYPHIFVVGDAADAFGAINAGHTAHFQAEVAANNVLKLVRHDLSLGTASGENLVKGGKDLKLDQYTPSPPGIKVSIGLRRNVTHMFGVTGTDENGRDDLEADFMWRAFGHDGMMDHDDVKP